MTDSTEHPNSPEETEIEAASAESTPDESAPGPAIIDQADQQTSPELNDSNLGDQETSASQEWMEEPLSHESESRPDLDPQGEDEPLVSNQPSRDPRTGRTFTRVTLGSALIALDTLSDRLEQVEAAEAEMEMPPRRQADVLVPLSEWGEQFGEPRNRAARYLALGMMADARDKANRGGRFLRGVSDATAGVINFVLAPIRRSGVARPAVKGFDAAVGRGESKVKHWMNLGRAEDARSRTVAEYALTNIADETMDDLVENERIQVFIQEIVEAQSMGIIDEAIEEVRERGVSTDYFVEKPIRRLLRRPPRDEVPFPDFDAQTIRPMRRRHIPLREGSLLGYYAGFVSRFLAFAIDIAILTIIVALSTWLITSIVQLFGLYDFYENVRQSSSIVNLGLTAFISLYGAALVIGYILIFWILTGQTIGMMVVGLRVVDKDGDSLTFLRAVARLIGFFIAGYSILLGICLDYC